MAEAPQLQDQQEEEEEQLPSSAQTTELDDGSEGSEEPDEVVKPARPLLSMRSMSTVDPDDDYPNMIVYRKVRAAHRESAGVLLICSEEADRTGRCFRQRQRGVSNI